MSKIAWINRPATSVDPATRTHHPTTGVVVALSGMMLVIIAAFIAGAAVDSIGAGADSTSSLASAFALNTFGLGVTKLGIAVILVGIVLALWRRVDSVRAALAQLVPTSDGQPEGRTTTGSSTIKTPFGIAKVTTSAPKPLAIHTMAEKLWLPMVVMGAMVLIIGLVVGFTASSADPGSESFRSLSAWTQGTLFLGEGLLLSGIALLLGTILSGLRRGGAEVQESLGVPIHTLAMPGTAKAFIGLMMLGMMAAIAQFILYGVAAANAGDPSTYAVWVTWLGPLREVALGVLLASIVLALATISRALGFQFQRIRDLATQSA